MNKKFNMEESIYEVRVDKEKAPSGITSISLSSILHLSECLFKRLITVTTRGFSPSDKIRFCIFSEALDRPISTCLMNISDASVEKILAAVMKVLQSKDEIPLDEAFEVNVITLRNPIGAGRSSICNIESDRYTKKYFIFFIIIPFFIFIF